MALGVRNPVLSVQTAEKTTNFLQKSDEIFIYPYLFITYDILYI